MARRKLDPKVKNARISAARRTARSLNTKLPGPYVYAYAEPSGRVTIRFEPPGGPKVRLYSTYPSPEFDEELAAAKRRQPISRKPIQADERLPARKREYAVGTFGALVQRYRREDKRWAVYEDQKRRDADLQKMLLARINPHSELVFRDLPLKYLDAGTVQTLMDLKLKQATIIDPLTGKTRAIWTNTEAANQRRKWLAAVLQFGVENKLIPFNYAQSIRRARKDYQGHSDKDDGFPTWTQEALAAYRAFHPPGSLPRLVCDVTYYTVARKSDLPRLGKHLVRKDRQGRDTLVYVQHKNRNRNPITVYQPIWPELQESLDAAERSGVLGSLLYIAQKPGTAGEKCYGADTLGNYMQDWIDLALKAAGLEHPPGPKGFSLHGLRKAGICNLILKGVPDRWIMAISGHRDPREIDRYGRRYMREQGAEGAFDIWLGSQKHRSAFDETEFERQFVASGAG